MKTTKKILVVDDNEGIIDLLSFGLEMRGYEVVCAINGEDGLDKFLSNSFDLVITDFSMPKMNGNELATSIRNFDKEIPIVLLSGSVYDKNVVLDETLFSLTLPKPFDLFLLISKIGRLIEISETVLV
ncbi:response regulator [bacterium]|nr:response regulator [bacterium]